MSDPTKISVDKQALFEVLRAITGHSHEIRELQVTRNLPLGPKNPIDILIADYNEGD